MVGITGMGGMRPERHGRELEAGTATGGATVHHVDMGAASRRIQCRAASEILVRWIHATVTTAEKDSS